jgi:hypothetical protein
MLNRRSLITGLISLVAAPAIVRAGSLMPVKVMQPQSYLQTMNKYLDTGVFSPEEVRALSEMYKFMSSAFAEIGTRFDPIGAFGWET